MIKEVTKSSWRIRHHKNSVTYSRKVKKKQKQKIKIKKWMN